jgi:hypothetical protein
MMPENTGTFRVSQSVSPYAMCRASFCAATATHSTDTSLTNHHRRLDLTSSYRFVHSIKKLTESTMKYNCPAIIAPSILSADLARLNDDSQQMLDMGAEWLHWYVIVHDLSL